MKHTLQMGEENSSNGSPSFACHLQAAVLTCDGEPTCDLDLHSIAPTTGCEHEVLVETKQPTAISRLTLQPWTHPTVVPLLAASIARIHSVDSAANVY